MEQNIKSAFKTIGDLLRNDGLGGLTFAEMMHLWISITDLELKDVIHLTPAQTQRELTLVHEKLRDVVDILDGDQLQEAACRLIKNVKVHRDPLGDIDFSVESGVDLNWDGNRWRFVSDPKLRLQEGAATYREALGKIQDMLNSSGE